MYILPYLLQISTKNLIINNLVNKFKEKITNIINKFIFSNIKNIYVKLTISLQELVNELSADFLKEFIEAVDLEFKNSEKRKKQFYINKSNVKRTIYTIFGDVTFYRTLYQDKYTHEYYNYIDDVLGLEAYKNYDPIVRGILIQDSVWSNPSHTAEFSSLNALHLKQCLEQKLSIPKQTIYLFKRQAKIGKIKYDEIKHGKTLYVMVDEKWVHKQDKTEPNKKKWIMVKCFVTFTGIERKGKRSRLLGKHTFITSSDKPWQEFMKVIPDIYNFEIIENINLLSDAGSWILSGASELKLYSNNKVIINTCEFHVKQKINRSTTDKELRQKISNIIYEENDKKSFIAEMDKLIDSKTKEARKQKIEEYKKYILNHWRGIQNMKDSLCKSSMEAHIEHCVASTFSSVPKAYSANHIEQYLKLHEMFLNGVSILNYYLQSFNSNDNFTYNNKEKELDLSMFKNSNSNVPILYTANNLNTALSGICHPSGLFR